MKLNNQILTLIFIVTSGLTYSQVEIRGIILSELTGKKPDAQIYVRELITKQSGTIADSLGHFRIEYLEPNKEYEIEIAAMGYRTQRFKVVTSDGITNELFVLDQNCKFDAEKANKDWKSGIPKLLIFGSIAPILNTKADNKFEEKYKIKYFDFGCSPPAMDCMKLYNERIFELMDEKYGKNWRREVRADFEYLN